MRTRSKAHERIGQIVAALAPFEAIGVAKSDDAIGQQLTAVVRTFWQGEIQMFDLGAVIGTHAGPGAGAIVALPQASEAMS